MQGMDMNQGYPQGTMQQGYAQSAQDDPYAQYRQPDSVGYQQMQQMQQPYPAYPQESYQGYPQGYTQGYPQGYPQGYSQTYAQGYPQGSPTGGYQVQQPVQHTFQGEYTGDYALQNGMNSGPYRVPQVSAATGEQIVYNAPMAPGDGTDASILTPQMTREGLVVSPKRHLGAGINKKHAIIACAAAAVLIAAAVLVYFLFFAGKTPYTAENVVAALYRRGLPIETPMIYSEATDPDGLLGTMNQYTSKVSWTDKRVSNGSDTLARGGIVEVFPSAELAQARLRQLNLMLPSQSGIATQVNRVVMRLSPDFSTAQATEYQQALKNMFGK